MATPDVVLKAMTKNKLEIACIANQIDFSEKNTKAQLMDLLKDTVESEQTLEHFYPYMCDEEIRVLQYYMEHQTFQGFWDRDYLFFFECIGFLCKKDTEILISDVLIDYLNKPHHALEQKRKQFNCMMQYFMACASLYGVFPFDIALDYYCKYEHKRMSNDEKQALLDMLYFKGLPFEPEDEFIINREVFIQDEDYADELFEAQEGKPYALLPKEELLKYLDINYIEKNKYYKKMKNMLCLLCGLSPEEGDEVTNHLSHMAKAQLEFDAIFEFLQEDFDITFESMEEYHQFVGAYADLSNHTRLWENCGFSPSELSKRLRPI
ncbi:MAG: hypothetical protein IJG23_04770 [Clostridia bacterium]|nr:hypothetical protein [Clostridia bacterium]